MEKSLSSSSGVKNTLYYGVGGGYLLSDKKYSRLWEGGGFTNYNIGQKCQNISRYNIRNLRETHFLGRSRVKNIL